MQSLLNPIIEYLKLLSQTVPLPIFTALGAAIEELIAPIPSPLVMTLAGSLTLASGASYTVLFYLALVGSVAKTIASLLVYLVSDKAEDLILGKFGRYLGITHQEIEQFGGYLSGGWKDDLVMLALRAIPVIPTSPVSIISGLLKLRLSTYLWTTLVGYTVRNLFYLYLGFTSIGALESLNEGLDNLENIGYLILFFLLAFLTLFFYQKRRESNVLSRLLKFLHLK